MCCFVVLVWFVLSCVIVVFSLLFGLLVFVIGRAGRGSLSHGFSIVTGYCRVVVFELLCMGCFACPRCYCLLCMLDVCVCVCVCLFPHGFSWGRGGWGFGTCNRPCHNKNSNSLISSNSNNNYKSSTTMIWNIMRGASLAQPHTE